MYERLITLPGGVLADVVDECVVEVYLEDMRVPGGVDGLRVAALLHVQDVLQQDLLATTA